MRKHPSSYLRVLHRHLSAFRNEERGSVLVIFAAAASVLLGLAGGAIDFNKRNEVSVRIQNAADAAVLVAARDPDALKATARVLANQMFNAGVTGLVDPNGNRPNLQLRFGSGDSARVGGEGVTATVSFNMPTGMMQIIGKKSLPVSIASAAAKPVNYRDVYVAMDLSESMLLAADEPERVKMENAVIARDGFSCMFACHITDIPGRDPYYVLAKQVGVKLRYENMVQGYGNFVSTYLDPNDVDVKAGRKRLSLIGFSDTATMLQPPTSLKASMLMAPSVFPVNKMWNTRYDVALPQIHSMIGAQGTGLTATSPTKGLLLITDGIQFYRNEVTDPYNGANADTSKNGPLTLALCDQIKAAGIPIAVIGMKFFIPPSGWVSGYVSAFKDQVEPNMRGCASAPDMYAEIEDTDLPALATAYDTMLLKLNTMPPLKLTR